MVAECLGCSRDVCGMFDGGHVLGVFEVCLGDVRGTLGRCLWDLQGMFEVCLANVLRHAANTRLEKTYKERSNCRASRGGSLLGFRGRQGCLDGLS